MNLSFNYHQDPSVLHVGCVQPHAYLIPFSTSSIPAHADMLCRAASDRFISLCGTWAFRYYASVDEVSDLSMDGAHTMQVPRS